VGNEPADGLGDGDRLGLCVVARGVAVPGLVVRGVVVPGLVVRGVVVPGLVVRGVVVPGLVVRGVVVLGVLLEVVALGVPLAEIDGVVEPVPPGENEGGFVDGEPDVQADTDAGASMAKAAQPRTVPRKRRRP
jgi:hypothetical protein